MGGINANIVVKLSYIQGIHCIKMTGEKND